MCDLLTNLPTDHVGVGEMLTHGKNDSIVLVKNVCSGACSQHCSEFIRDPGEGRVLVVRRVEREGGGISKPLHLYLCFVFSFEECWEKKESGGILKPFPVSRVPVTIEVRIKIKIVL